jgi:hypothetical protein
MSKAIRFSDDWHFANVQNKKYTIVEQGTVPYKPPAQARKSHALESEQLDIVPKLTVMLSGARG